MILLTRLSFNILIISPIFLLCACQSSTSTAEQDLEPVSTPVYLFENAMIAQRDTPSHYGIQMSTITLDDENMLPGINVAQAISNEVRIENFAGLDLIPRAGTSIDTIDFSNLAAAILYLLEDDTLRASYWTIQDAKEHPDPELHGSTATLDISSMYELAHTRFPEVDAMLLIMNPKNIKNYHDQKFTYDVMLAEEQ